MTTLTAIYEELLSHRRSLNYSSQTESGFRSSTMAFISYIEDYFAVTTPDRIRKAHLHAYQKHLTELTGKTGLPMKPRTINNRIGSVHNLLTFMHQNGYISQTMTDALVFIKEPRMLPSSVLTHAQVKKLMRKIDTTTATGIRDRAILELLYSSGIRGGELVSLTLDRIDLDRGCIRVFGKGSKERIVPVGKTALRYLTSYIRGIRPFVCGSGEYRQLFLNNKGRPYQQRVLQRIIPMYAEKAKLDIRVTPHTFRRSCTTEMIKGNANIYHVKEMLGHESIDTLKPYIKLTINDLKKTHAKCHPRERDDPR